MVRRIFITFVVDHENFTGSIDYDMSISADTSEELDKLEVIEREKASNAFVENFVIL